MVLEKQLEFEFIKEKSLSEKLIEMGTLGLLSAASLALVTSPYLFNAIGVKADNYGDYIAGGAFVGTGVVYAFMTSWLYKEWKK